MADKTAHQRIAGGGVPMRWQCFGCGQIKGLTGSRGAGVWKRCIDCVAKRQAA
jgi:hypothetical protein